MSKDNCFMYRGKVFRIHKHPESSDLYLEWLPGGMGYWETRLDENCPLCGHRVHNGGCFIYGKFKGRGIGRAKAFLKSRMKRSERIARLIALDVKVYNYHGLEVVPRLTDGVTIGVPGWAEV